MVRVTISPTLQRSTVLTSPPQTLRRSLPPNSESDLEPHRAVSRTVGRST